MGILRVGSRESRYRRRFRDMCLSFPGAVEVVDGKKSVYRVGKEPFAFFDGSGEKPRVSIRIGPEDYTDRSAERRVLTEKHRVLEGYVTLSVDRRLHWEELNE